MSNTRWSSERNKQQALGETGRGPEAQEGSGGAAPGAGERPIRVLVVDDEPLIVQMLSIALKYEKFEVSVARDGTEAIQQASLTKPDLVILDIMLPNMDGIEV